MTTVDELLGAEGIDDETQAQELLAWAQRRAAQLVQALADDPELGPLLAGTAEASETSPRSEQPELESERTAAAVSESVEPQSVEERQAEPSDSRTSSEAPDSFEAREVHAASPEADEAANEAAPSREAAEERPHADEPKRTGDSIAGPLPPIPERRAEAEDHGAQENDEEIEELDDIELLEDDDLELVEDVEDSEPSAEVPEWKSALATAQSDDVEEMLARSAEES